MPTIDALLCDGCKTCVSVCPHAVLEISKKKAFVAFGEGCIECGACELNCPTSAIKVKKGTGCLAIIIKEDILGLKEEKACCG